MTHAEIERPRCECHDVPMILRNERASGYRCAVGHRAADKAYMRTKGGRMARRDGRMRRVIRHREARIVERSAQIEAIRAAAGAR